MADLLIPGFPAYVCSNLNSDRLRKEVAFARGNAIKMFLAKLQHIPVLHSKR